MIQKIQNRLVLTVRSRLPTGKLEDFDMTGATNIILSIKQKFGQYIELEAAFVERRQQQILGYNKIIATLPYDEAMKLTLSPTEVQLMWVDKDGNPRATKAKPIPVDKLLREAGYD